MKPLAELLALLRRHLFPAFSHSLAYSLAYSPLHSSTRIAMPTTTHTKASEQNAAESQQSESLPEGNLPESEQRRRQPVPQEHHYFAADRGEDHYPQDRRWSHPNQSLHSLLSVVHVSVPHLFVNLS